jgi:ferrous iron transport protein A
MRLTDLPIGQQAQIVSINDEVAILLGEMGCHPGVKVSVENKAPLGDPIAVMVETTKLSLRKALAAQVEVQVST